MAPHPHSYLLYLSISKRLSYKSYARANTHLRIKRYHSPNFTIRKAVTCLTAIHQTPLTTKATLWIPMTRVHRNSDRVLKAHLVQPDLQVLKAIKGPQALKARQGSRGTSRS